MNGETKNGLQGDSGKDLHYMEGHEGFSKQTQEALTRTKEIDSSV